MYINTCLRCPASLVCFGFGFPDFIKTCERCGRVELEYYTELEYHSTFYGDKTHSFFPMLNFIIVLPNFECNNVDIKSIESECTKCMRKSYTQNA